MVAEWKGWTDRLMDRWMESVTTITTTTIGVGVTKEASSSSSPSLRTYFSLVIAIVVVATVVEWFVGRVE